MGTVYPSSLFSNSSYNWLFQGNMKSRAWTKEENKEFEKALAIYDEKTPDRWRKVAAMIPGKSVRDVIKQYQDLIEDVTDIEAGLVPIPGYLASPFTLDLVHNYPSLDYPLTKPTSSLPTPHEHERKKGVPWTQDEHRRFLLGLEKHGKGDWRNISRNFVISKTPTQVASHAQKYFLRQNSGGGKDKRRASIHDITTVNLSSDSILSDSDNKTITTHQINHQSDTFPLLQKSINIMPKMLFDWSNSSGEAFMVFNSGHGRRNLCTSAYQGAHVGSN